MDENINIAEILKDAPKGTPLYSTILGECTLDHISGDFIWVLSPKCDVAQAFTKEGYIIFKNTWCSEVCCLFPSKHHATWNDFKSPWKYKHFEAFQKVLYKSYNNPNKELIWTADFYSHYCNRDDVHYTIANYCAIDDADIIPFEGNEDKVGKPAK